MSSKNKNSINKNHSQTSKNKEKMKKTGLSKSKSEQATAAGAKSFVYEPATVSVKSLKIHPLLDIIGYDFPDDIFIERTNYFKFYERCVITEDGLAITHPTDLLAAQRSGVKEMEVVVMKNAFLNDVIDFISFKNVWKHGKSRRKIFEMAKFLTGYVMQKDKEWKAKFNSTKTRGIVAEIMGISDGTVQAITSIGKKDESLLDKIDNKETNSTKAISLIKLSKPTNEDNTIESRKRYANLIISNNPDVGNGAKAQLHIRSAKFEIDEIGTLEFRTETGRTALYINDNYLKDVFHNVVSDKDYDKKREYCQHHTLLPNDDSFDVQFILKGIEKFIDNQKIAA